MKIRGVPAIGIAGAFGLSLAVKSSVDRGFKAFKKEMDGIIRYLSSARPTANDLFWALSRVKQATEINFLKPGGEIKKIMLKEAKVLLKEDMHKCPFIGENGKKFLRKVTRC